MALRSVWLMHPEKMSSVAYPLSQLPWLARQPRHCPNGLMLVGLGERLRGDCEKTIVGVLCPGSRPRRPLLNQLREEPDRHDVRRVALNRLDH